jgi:hypothetical protein
LLRAVCPVPKLHRGASQVPAELVARHRQRGSAAESSDDVGEAESALVPVQTGDDEDDPVPAQLAVRSPCHRRGFDQNAVPLGQPPKRVLGCGDRARQVGGQRLVRRDASSHTAQVPQESVETFVPQLEPSGGSVLGSEPILGVHTNRITPAEGASGVSASGTPPVRNATPDALFLRE